MSVNLYVYSHSEEQHWFHTEVSLTVLKFYTKKYNTDVKNNNKNNRRQAKNISTKEVESKYSSL